MQMAMKHHTRWRRRLWRRNGSFAHFALLLLQIAIYALCAAILFDVLGALS